MSSEPPTGAVRLDGLTKVYDRRSADRAWRNARPGPPPPPLAPVVALDRVDLVVEPGTRLGLIGANGAGKSTLVKILAGVTRPTTGTAAVGGRLGAMVELGVGFHPDLTGSENVRAGAAIAGLGPAAIGRIEAPVADFAELGPVMDQPLRTYSTGMRARLGFALATHLPTDVLVVDEVLAVGDPDFQEKCIARIDERCTAGMTLLLVSHEMWLIDSVCDRAARLDGGTLVDTGPAAEVIDRYLTPHASTDRPRSDGPITLRSVSVDDAELRQDEPIHFRLVIDRATEAPDPPPATDVEVAVALASLAPDLPVGVARRRLPEEALTSGRPWPVVCSPVPADTAHVLLTARLIDARQDVVVGEAAAELWVERGLVGRRPQLPVTVTWSLEERRDQDDGPVSAIVARPDGPLVAELVEVTKRFRTRHRRGPDPRALPGRLGEDQGGDLAALDEVTLPITGGTALGVVGPNGAGKTTLLRLLAGTLAPTTGTVRTTGRVVSMLELGIGFHPDLDGLANLEAAGRLLGLGRRALARRQEEILAFADIGAAVTAPMRQYSSGMRARLGLALAVHAEPDLLLIDEALAVGDEQFRTRAILAVDRLARAGAAVVFVSHDLPLVEEICPLVARLDRGRLTAHGRTEDVLALEGVDDEAGQRRNLTAVELGPLGLERRRVVSGGHLAGHATIEVSEDAPWLRLELRYLARAPGVVLDLDDRTHTIAISVLEPAGARLARPTRQVVRFGVDGNRIAGVVAVCLVAVDERDESAAAVTWRNVTFGNPRPGGLTPVSYPVEIAWGSPT